MAVKMIASEATLARRLELPPQLPARAVDGVKIAVVTAEVDGVRRNCGRRGDPGVRLERPPLFSSRGVERVKLPIGTSDVQRVGSDDRRRDYLAVGVEGPFDVRRVDRSAAGEDS